MIRYLRLFGKQIKNSVLEKEKEIEKFENELREKGWYPNEKPKIDINVDYKTRTKNYYISSYALYKGKRKALEKRYLKLEKRCLRLV